MDLAPGGCFVLTYADWGLGTQAWMVLRDLPDCAPIPVVVRWAQPWGQARHLPGIGVEFVGLSMAQVQEIAGLLGILPRGGHQRWRSPSACAWGRGGG